MNRHSHKVFLLIMLLLAPAAFANSAKTAPWVLELNKQGIMIQSRSVQGSSVREIRAELIVTTGLKKLIAFLQDAKMNTEWVPYSGGADIIAQPIPQKTIVHFKMQSQWPFKPRDAVTAFTLAQATNKTVTIDIESLPDFIPKTSGLVRLETYEGFWQLTPQEGGRIKIIYQSRVDPGGMIPGWLSNRFSIQTTFEALQNLKQQLPNYRADISYLTFIEE